MGNFFNLFNCHPCIQSGNVAFFKNAKHVRTVQLTREHMAQELYASVGIASPGGVVRAVHMSGAAAAAAGKDAKLVRGRAVMYLGKRFC